MYLFFKSEMPATYRGMHAILPGRFTGVLELTIRPPCSLQGRAFDEHLRICKLQEPFTNALEPPWVFWDVTTHVPARF